MKKNVFVSVSAFFLLFLTGIASANEIFPTDSITIVTDSGRLELTVEVATTEKQKEQGLMFRESLPMDHGMIFNLAAPQHVEMWMKNTLIPLDMLFIDNHGIVTQIVKNAKPKSLDIISSKKNNVLAVLEVNGGAADYYHITNGSRVLYSLFK